MPIFIIIFKIPLKMCDFAIFYVRQNCYLGAFMEYRQLIEIAFELKENAYAPYTGFKSCAVLLSKNGEVYTGCSIEIAGLVSSVTAVQSAFSNAITSGEKSFEALVLIGGIEEEELDYCPPTGVCRQIIQEFCSPDFKIILARSIQDYIIYTFEDLFPFAFSRKNLLGE